VSLPSGTRRSRTRHAPSPPNKPRRPYALVAHRATNRNRGYKTQPGAKDATAVHGVAWGCGAAGSAGPELGRGPGGVGRWAGWAVARKRRRVTRRWPRVPITAAR